MNVYQAFKKAADHIEGNPHLFEFDNIRIPTCGTPGCALGWLAHFMNFADMEANVGDFADRILPVNEGTFYERMNRVSGTFNVDWISDAALCAKFMRLYAAKYHAPPVAAPDWNSMATAGFESNSKEGR